MRTTLGFKVTKNGQKYRIERTPEDGPTTEKTKIYIDIEYSPGNFQNVEIMDLGMTPTDSQECWDSAEEAVEFHSGSEVVRERKKF